MSTPEIRPLVLCTTVSDTRLSMVTLLLVLGTSLSISFLCSILEAVLLSVSHSYVALLREQGDRAGEYWHRMQESIDEPIAAILTLNTIAHTVGATLGGAMALQLFGDRWLAVFSAVLTLAILLFSEIIPKTIGATFWRQLGRPSAYLLRGMIWVMKPVLIPLNLFSSLIKGDRPSTVTRGELEALAEMGHREGTIDEDEWQVVSNIIRLDEVTVGEVMTPRTDMIAIQVEATVDEAMGLMLEEGHLRLPVYERSPDKIVGLLLARDLWRADRSGTTRITDLLHPIQFYPATKSVEDLIPEMRRQRSKMAIVVDEFGGTAGLVTLEDLIEEIIGEIQDEHESDEPVAFQPLDDGRIEIWGGVPVREVNDSLDSDLPEDVHDTIGGFVFGALNRVGKVGDCVQVRDGEFRVVRMKGRRIEYVVFTPAETKSR